ncbi:hypothetical protein [Rhodopseudomonas palustris]|uniref:hypothetical protein n=1 Tax=Rhodopseudomonas palustris TaxID=1076 RepID=UPI001F226CF0|nr:hypothetical protein [Rhodopseudomonas palustris]
MVDKLLAACAEAGDGDNAMAERANAANGSDSSEVDSSRDRRRPAQETDDMTGTHGKSSARSIGLAQDI